MLRTLVDAKADMDWLYLGLGGGGAGAGRPTVGGGGLDPFFPIIFLLYFVYRILAILYHLHLS